MRYTDGSATIIVISPLQSIISDQLSEMKRVGCVSADISALSSEQLRACEYRILHGSAEVVTTTTMFRDALKDKHSTTKGNLER